MLLAIAAVIIGLGLLIWSADRFVDGAAATAGHLGMSPMLIGLTIVAFGTSAPEMLVSTMAALDKAPGLAIGNAIGSNIANIALVLGVTLLVAPFMVNDRCMKTEYPILLLATLFVGLLVIDDELSPGNGWLMVFLLVVIMGFLSPSPHTC